jgi:hypothetical protein
MRDKDRQWLITVGVSLTVLVHGCVMVCLDEQFAGILLLLVFTFMVGYGVLGFRFK